MQAIQHEWLRRVEAEYGSAALTHHLTLWLLQLTAPLELVRMGLAIVEDELAHAELSQAVYLAAGGSGMARLERERLGLKLRPGEPLELAVARVGLESFCLGGRWLYACSRGCASHAGSRLRWPRSIASYATRCGTATSAGPCWSGC